MNFQQYAAANPSDDPLDTYKGYSGFAKLELLKSGQFTPEDGDEIDARLIQHAMDEGLDLGEDPVATFTRPKNDPDLESVATFADDAPTREAAAKLRALKDTKDLWADSPEEYQSQLEAATATYSAAATPEVKDRTRRQALLQGQLPYAIFEDGRMEISPSLRDVAGNDEALAKVFEANPSLDPRDLGTLKRKLTTPAGYDVPEFVIDRQNDFNEAFTALQAKDPAIGEKLNNLRSAADSGREDNLDPKLDEVNSILQNAGLGTEYSQDELRNFTKDYLISTTAPAVDETNVDANLRKLSSGQIHVPLGVMLNRPLFEKTLKESTVIPDAQRETLAASRDQRIEAFAKDAFEVIQKKRPEFTKFYDAQKQAGATDAAILDQWMENPENYSALRDFSAGIGESVIEGIGGLALYPLAMAGNDAAREAIAGLQQSDADRRAYARLFGKNLGVGYDLSRLVAPVAADVGVSLLTAGAAAPVVGAKTAFRAALKNTLGTALKAETKSLAKNFTLKAAARQGAANSLDDVLTLAGKDIAEKFTKSATTASYLATAFNRSAGATYVQLHSALEKQKNADGSPKYTPEQTREIALNHGLVAGAITAAVTGGFSFMGAAGMERIYDGMTRRQLTGVFNRLKSDWGKLSPAVREGLDVTNADKFLESVVRKAVAPMWSSAAKPILEEGAEEGLDEFLGYFNQQLATGEKINVADAAKQAGYAALLGGVMGGTVTGINSAVRGDAPDANVEQQLRTKTLLDTAAKLDAAHSPNTAAVLRRFALQGFPDPQESVPEGESPVGDEPAPGDAGVDPTAAFKEELTQRQAEVQQFSAPVEGETPGQQARRELRLKDAQGRAAQLSELIASYDPATIPVEPQPSQKMLDAQQRATTVIPSGETIALGASPVQFTTEPGFIVEDIDQMPERDGEPATRWQASDGLGSAEGFIDTDGALIISNIEAKARGTGFLNRVLAQSPSAQVRIPLQSAKMQKAVAKLVADGVLTAPSDPRGVENYPTSFTLASTNPDTGIPVSENAEFPAAEVSAENVDISPENSATSSPLEEKVPAVLSDEIPVEDIFYEQGPGEVLNPEQSKQVAEVLNADVPEQAVPDAREAVNAFLKSKGIETNGLSDADAAALLSAADGEPGVRVMGKREQPSQGGGRADFGFTDVPTFLRETAANGPKELRSVAKLLMRFSPPTVTVVDLPGATWAGAFVPSTRQVLLNAARPGPRGPVDTVIHELIHAATEESVLAPTAEQEVILKRLDRIRRSVAKRATGALSYGLSSNSEFVAHALTSPDFMRQVAAMTPKGERSWARVILDTIADLLNGRARTQAERITSQVMEDLVVFINTIPARTDQVAANPKIREQKALTEDEVFAHRLASAKAEILADIASGDIPETVKSFEELHDYVDANEYVNDAEREDRMIGPLGKSLGWRNPEYIDFTNRLLDEIDAWLANGRSDIRFQPADQPLTPASVRQLAESFAPEGLELTIDFDQLARDLSGITGPNAEDMVSAMVNRDVARQAGREAVGDEDLEKLIDIFDRTITGNTSRSDELFYRGNPTQLERLVRYLEGAVKAMWARLELRFDVKTAMTVDRLTKAIADAKDGYRVRSKEKAFDPEQVGLRLQPASNEGEFNQEVQKYVTGNWPSTPEGKYDELRRFTKEWVARYGDNFNIRIEGGDIGWDAIRGTSPRFSSVDFVSTEEPAVSIRPASILESSGMDGLSEFEAKKARALEINEEVIHRAFLESIAKKMGSPNVDKAVQYSVDAARDLIGYADNVGDEKLVNRIVSDSLDVYSRGDVPANKKNIGLDALYTLINRTPFDAYRAINEILRQVVQSRRNGSITESSYEGVLQTLKPWHFEKAAALTEMLKKDTSLGRIFEEEIRGIEQVMDSRGIRFQPAAGDQYTGYVKVYDGALAFAGKNEKQSSKSWFARMFTQRDDMPGSWSDIKVSKAAVQVNIDKQLERLGRDYDKAIKAESPDMDVVRQAVGSTAPLLTPDEETRINDELTTRLEAASNLAQPRITEARRIRDNEVRKAKRAASPEAEAAARATFEMEEADALAMQARAYDAIADWERAEKDRSMVARAAELRRVQSLAMQALEKNAPLTYKWADEIRSTINEFQRHLTDWYGDSRPELAAIIDRSNGVYLARSYKFHADPALAEMILHDPKFAELQERAIEWFGRELAADRFEEIKNLPEFQYTPEDDLREVARKAVADKAKLLFQDFVMGHESAYSAPTADGIKTEFQRFMQKRNLDPMISEILGEIDDPQYNAGRTLAAVSSILFSQKMLAAVKKDGLEKGYIVTKAEVDANPAKYRNWEPVVAANVHSQAFAPLAGYYAAPEDVEAWQAAFNPARNGSKDTAGKASEDFNKLILGLAGTSMGVVTLGNPGFFSRNLLGSSIIAAAQGVNLFSRDGKASVKAAYDSAFNKGNDTELVEKLVTLGVLHNGAQVSYLRDFLKRYREDPVGALDWIAQKGLHLSPEAVEVLTKQKNKWSKLIDTLGNAAEFTETIGNTAIYLRELKTMVDSGLYETQEEAEQAAAQRTKMVVPSKSEAPQASVHWGKNPVSALVAPFVNFKVQMIRTIWNTYKLGLDDIKRGRELKNDVLIDAGIHRLMWAGVIHAGLTVLVPLVLQKAAGLSDEEDRAIREALPDYSKNSQFWTFKTDEGIRTWDLTFSNPFSLPFDVVTQGFRAMRSGNFAEIPQVAARFVTDELLGEQIVAGKVLDVKRNINEGTGMPIWIDADDYSEKIAKGVIHIVGGSFTPAAIKKIAQAYEATDRPIKEDDQLFYTPAGIVLGTTLPTRPREFKTEDLAYRAFRNLSRSNGQLWTITNPLSSPAGMGEGDAAEIYNDRVQAGVKVWKKAFQMAKAFEDLGMTKSEIIHQMTEAGLSKERSLLAYRGKTDRPVLASEKLQDIREIDQKRHDEVVKAMKSQARVIDLR